MSGDERAEARTRMGAEEPQDQGALVGADLQETGSASPGEPGSDAARDAAPGDRPSSAADAVDASGAPQGAGGGLAAPDAGVTGGTADEPAERAESASAQDEPGAGFSSDDRDADPNRRGEGMTGTGGVVRG